MKTSKTSGCSCQAIGTSQGESVKMHEQMADNDSMCRKTSGANRLWFGKEDGDKEMDVDSQTERNKHKRPKTSNIYTAKFKFQVEYSNRIDSPQTYVQIAENKFQIS